jgi:hypothetical protein
MGLFSWERRWAGTIARALLPSSCLGGQTSGRDAAALIAVEVSHGPWFDTLLVRAGLWLIWLSPLWHLLRFRTFGGLLPEAREALLERLLHHRRYSIRQIVNYMKMLVCMVILGDEPTLANLGAYRPKLPPAEVP